MTWMGELTGLMQAINLQENDMIYEKTTEKPAQRIVTDRTLLEDLPYSARLGLSVLILHEAQTLLPLIADTPIQAEVEIAFARMADMVRRPEDWDNKAKPKDRPCIGLIKKMLRALMAETTHVKMALYLGYGSEHFDNSAYEPRDIQKAASCLGELSDCPVTVSGTVQ